MELSLTLFIVAATVIVSLLAFRDRNIFDKLSFYPYVMWRDKEWYRLLTHGFVHADIGHLFFNMFALFSFGNYIEASFAYIFPGKGVLIYVLIYFIGICVASIYDLFTHRDDYSYRSIGASGGVSAIVFAYVLLNPLGSIYLFFIPIGIPAVIFGGLYLFYCAYMAKRGTDNIGHTAHFSGAIFGFLMPILLKPQLLLNFIEKIQNKL